MTLAYEVPTTEIDGVTHPVARPGDADSSDHIVHYRGDTAIVITTTPWNADDDRIERIEDESEFDHLTPPLAEREDDVGGADSTDSDSDADSEDEDEDADDGDSDESGE